MNYIDEIFKRADIQKIRGFLLSGEETDRIDPRPYKERIESAHEAFRTRMHTDHPDENELEKAAEPFYEYVNAVEEVYMEIGLQIGAILAAQTAQSLKTAFSNESLRGYKRGAGL